MPSGGCVPWSAAGWVRCDQDSGARALDWGDAAINAPSNFLDTGGGVLQAISLAVGPTLGYTGWGSSPLQTVQNGLSRGLLPACDGAWHHVAQTFAPAGSNGTLRAFVDGTLIAQVAVSVRLPAAAVSTLRVGKPGSSYYIGGGIAVADLRVYNRSLSLAEVVALSQPALAAFAAGSNASALAPPNAGATAYAFACAAGFFGAPALLSRGPFDGVWAWAGGLAPQCAACAAGRTSTGGQAPCSLCAPGTFSLAGAAACLPCPAGTYGASAGLTSAACSGACAGCAAGTAYPPSSGGGGGGVSGSGGGTLSCVAPDARAVPAPLGLQLWPAAHPSNPQGVDLVIAPLATCQQITSAAACSAAASITGADGVARYALGTAAAFNMQAAETLTCS
jgi:hypothetical protein